MINTKYKKELGIDYVYKSQVETFIDYFLEVYTKKIEDWKNLRFGLMKIDWIFK